MAKAIATDTLKRFDQSIFKKRGTVRDMAPMIRMGAMLNKTVFFYGGAGLGKSENVQLVANAMFPERIGNNLCDVRLSDKEPQDVAGIPFPLEFIVNGVKVVRTVYATPSFWPTDPDWKGIVFLDELTNAIGSVQQSAYQVILDHVIGDFRFPKGCVFVAAGNRDTDNGNTSELLGPLVNRMMLMEIDYDLKVWIEDYAVPFNLNPIGIGFLKTHPEYFYTGDVEDRTTPVFASPRQWKTVCDVLDLLDKGSIEQDHAEFAIQGMVGEGLDTLILAYYERAKKLPALEDIFSGKVTEHHLDRTEVDLVYVLSQSGLRQIRKEIMDNSISDNDFIARCGNFLTFMYNNHGEGNKDTVMALSTSLFRAAQGEEAILMLNPKREKMMPMLRKKCPIVMEIVMKYHERYGDLMEHFK